MTEEEKQHLAKILRQRSGLSKIAKKIRTTREEAAAFVFRIERATGTQFAYDRLVWLQNNIGIRIGGKLDELEDEIIKYIKGEHPLNIRTIEKTKEDRIRALARVICQNIKEKQFPPVPELYAKNVLRESQDNIWSIDDYSMNLLMYRTLSSVIADQIGISSHLAFVDVVRKYFDEPSLRVFFDTISSVPNRYRNRQDIIHFLELFVLLYEKSGGKPSYIYDLHKTLQQKVATDITISDIINIIKSFEDYTNIADSDILYVLKVRRWIQGKIVRWSSFRLLDQKDFAVITNQAAPLLNEELFHEMSDICDATWTEITSAARTYQVPTMGKAEISLSKQVVRVLGLERIQFVQEGIEPPGVFIIFHFARPCGIAVLRIAPQGDLAGFLDLIPHPFLRMLFPLIALLYYRDLVVPAPAYASTREQTKHKGADDLEAQEEMTGSAGSSRSRPGSPGERRQLPRRKHQQSSGTGRAHTLDDWYEAQGYQKHIVGYPRWVRPGYQPPDELREAARAAGVRLSPGYTWVREHDRSIGLIVDGQDLSEPVLFAPPSRATHVIRKFFLGWHPLPDM